MSKSTIVEIINQNGHNYGQISSPEDINKAQEYAHDHVERVTQDFLTNLELAEVADCDYSLPSLLNILIEPGRIYLTGRQYDVAETTVTLAPASSQYTRIDLVVATLAQNVPANTEFLAFQRLRSEQEFIDSQPPYPPTQFQRATERHHLAPVSVKTGIPAANPLPPALGANEVILYTITLPANTTVLLHSMVKDSRRKVSNISGITEDIDSLLARIKLLEEKILVLKYRYPTILSGNGKLPVNLVNYNGTWVVDIAIGIDVQFGDGFIRLKAENFLDPAVNAQYVNISNNQVQYLPLIEPSGTPTHNPTSGNQIRFIVPATTKALYLNRAGELFFRSEILPSGSDECLLLKTVRVGSAAPTIKTFRNIRNCISNYSKIRAASDPTTIQLELDLGVPAGVLYPYAHATRATDGLRYDLPPPTPVFDGTVHVTGVADGDRWFLDVFILAGL